MGFDHSYVYWYNLGYLRWVELSDSWQLPHGTKGQSAFLKGREATMVND